MTTANTATLTKETTSKLDINQKMNIPEIPERLTSTLMCSGQPKFTIEQIKGHFPSLLQNIMKINLQMKPAEGTTFKGSNFVWSIQQFFKMCKSHDKEFRILPWNIEEQNDDTIKSSSLTDHKQIPEMKEAFEEYGYNIHVSLHRLSLTMVISTSYSTFEKMFKDSAKRNEEKQSILRQFRERQVWVTKNDLSTMGTTKFVGFLCYAHPYLTNQYKLMNELRKITKIPDLTVEHYNPKIFKKEIGKEKAKLLCSTVAYCVGAPADISVDVMQMIVEKWQDVRKGKYATILGPTSNIHKFLFIPMSKVLMSDENRAVHMRNNNNFRYSYNGISLNKTRSVDIPFNLTNEECETIGYDTERTKDTVTIRSIINSWESPDDERQLVWMIEPANEQRQVLVIKEQFMEAVRRELSTLFELLKKRPDFQEIVGGNLEAHVDGYQAHTPEAKEYMEVLQETLVQVNNSKKEEYPALSPPKTKLDKLPRQRKNRMFNPYATRKFNQTAQYADVIQNREDNNMEKRKQHKHKDSNSETTNAESTVSSLTNSTDKSNKQEKIIRHPNQLKNNNRINNRKVIDSTAIVKKTTGNTNVSTTSTAIVTNDSRSNEMINFTEREQCLLNHIEEQGRRLKLLEQQQETTLKEMKESQKLQNKKIESTINAKLQPHHDKLESISMSIDNMKVKSETNNTTMEKLDARFERLDNRLEKMMNAYETIAQLQASQLTSQILPIQREEKHQCRANITQTQEEQLESNHNKYERKDEATTIIANNDKSLNQRVKHSTQEMERKNIWKEQASPQPKRTPNKKIERIQDSKTSSVFNTPSTESPTTDEKGKERGDKRLKMPHPNNNNKEQLVTTKIKQEMIDEVMINHSTDVELQQGTTAETSIAIEEMDDKNEWITMGKNNTPRNKEKMKRRNTTLPRSPVGTRSTHRSEKTNNTTRNEQNINTTTIRTTKRIKSPKQRRTVATQNPTRAVKQNARESEAKRGQVGLRGAS